MSTGTRSNSKRSTRSKSKPQTDDDDASSEYYKDDDGVSSSSESSNGLLQPPKKKQLQQKKPAAKAASKKQKTTQSNKRGRPTKVENKRKELVGQEKTALYIRFGWYERNNKSTKKPKQWPDRSDLYMGYRMPTLYLSLEQLVIRAESLLGKYNNVYELCNDDDDDTGPFVFANQAGTNSSFKAPPLVNENLKGKKKFDPIACDQTLEFAIKNYSAVVEVEEPCNDSDESEDSDDAGALSGRTVPKIECLLLDLVVFVKKKKPSSTVAAIAQPNQASKKSDYDTIKIEFLPLVEKNNEGDPVTDKGRVLGSFKMTKIDFDSHRLGTLRLEIAQQAVKKKIDGYVTIATDDDSETTLHFGDRSAIYLADSLRTKVMKKMLTMDDVKEAINARAKMEKNGAKEVNGRKVVTIKMALGKMQKDDTQYDHEQDDTTDAVLDESQQPARYDSPALMRAGKKGGSRRAAVESLHEETTELLRKLYLESGPEANLNPYYHGFTAKMHAILRSRFQNKDNFDPVKELLDVGEWPTVLQLFGSSLKPTDRQPERGKYPPDAGGRPPVVVEGSDDEGGLKKLSHSIARLVDAQIASGTKATPATAPGTASTIVSTNVGPRVFRFKRGDVQVDVEWVDVVKASSNEFTGKDVWALAKQEDKAGVFKVPKEQKQLLKDGKADVFLELAQHSHLRLSKEKFESKLANELLQYFGEQHGIVEFEIKVIQRPDYDTDAMSDLDL